MLISWDVTDFIERQCIQFHINVTKQIINRINNLAGKDLLERSVNLFL